MILRLNANGECCRTSITEHRFDGKRTATADHSCWKTRIRPPGHSASCLSACATTLACRLSLSAKAQVSWRSLKPAKRSHHHVDIGLPLADIAVSRNPFRTSVDRDLQHEHQRLNCLRSDRPPHRRHVAEMLPVDPTSACEEYPARGSHVSLTAAALHTRSTSYSSEFTKSGDFQAGSEECSD